MRTKASGSSCQTRIYRSSVPTDLNARSMRRTPQRPIRSQLKLVDIRVGEFRGSEDLGKAPEDHRELGRDSVLAALLDRGPDFPPGPCSQRSQRQIPGDLLLGRRGVLDEGLELVAVALSEARWIEPQQEPVPPVQRGAHPPPVPVRKVWWSPRSCRCPLILRNRAMESSWASRVCLPFSVSR